MKAKLVALLLATGAFAGCFGGDDGSGPAIDLDQEAADRLLGDDRSKLVDAAAIIPKNYSMPLQKLLPQVEVAFQGTVDSSAIGSYEGERDESGIDYNSIIATHDIASLLPEGQPVELVIDLYWDASEANSADLDIFVDVPGTKTSYSPISETLNWNYVLKTVVVNTIGVPGQPALVGAQISSGVVSQGFSYQMEVRATYVKDVLTPYHAWALNVPSGAGGLIFESVKAGGDEHVNATFVVIDPDDNLLKFVQFDDINIPSESILIPVTKPGQYVVYAQSMHGGFLLAKTDVPLEDNVATPLALVEEEVVDMAGPAPGLAGKDPLYGAAGGNVPDDDIGAAVVDISLTSTFPLRVSGFIRGPLTTEAKITLTSPLGVVHKLTRIAYYEDDQGSIGYTSDHEGREMVDGRQEGGINNMFAWHNLQKGAWQASIINDNINVEVGHKVLTYVR